MKTLKAAGLALLALALGAAGPPGAACATPIISDPWEGLDAIFKPGRDILVAPGGDVVLGALTTMPETQRRAVGSAGRSCVLAGPTAAHRAMELEGYIAEAARQAR